MSARRISRAAAVLAAVAVLALIAIPAAIAAFSAKTQSEGNIITAASDFAAPTVSTDVVAKTLGGTAGFVRSGGSYYIYANVTDTGNPATGVASVKANVAEITSTQTAVALTLGTYTAGGVSYNYRSGELTANAAVEGSKTYSVTAVDNAGNSGTVNGTATVDNAPPKATDIQTTNVAGGTNGLAEAGDTIVFTYSEPIEPQSVLAGWNGTATNVVVRLVDNGILGLATGNDEVMIWNAANSTQLPLGAVNMGRGDYVAGLLGGFISFGVTGTPSTMTMSGNTITVTLGTELGVLVGPTTAAGTGTMVWTPVATPYDRAGNVLSTTAATESGAADKDF